MLGEMWETKQFSKVLQNSLKVIYLQQTTKKLLHFQPFALSREEIQFFSWFSRVLEYLFCEISISKLSENGPKLYIIYRVWWKYWNWYLMEFLTGGGGGYCFWDHFLKYWKFDCRCDVIYPKTYQKCLSWLFQVPMLTERWKSKVKWNLRWSIYLWNYFFEIAKF